MRILMVEDEFLAAIVVMEDLREAGHTILGPYNTLDRATEAARSEEFELAILDINLNGEMAYPLADELAGRKVPVVLLTGYGARDLPERYKSWPRVTKPHDPSTLRATVEEARRQTAR